MSFTLGTSGAIIAKAGADASTDVTSSGVLLAQFSDEVESQIINTSRYDWVTNFGAADTNAKLMLGNIHSSLAAMKVINYDMSGYPTRSIAETMLDVLRDDAQQGLKLIKEQVNVSFIK